MRACSCLFVGLLLVASPAFGNDWYVDGVNGNDSNSGSQTAPFQSIWHAVMSVAQPGDTVYVLPTTIYSGFGIFGKSGKPGAPITIVGAGTGRHLTQVNGGGSNFGIQINTDSNGAPSSYIVVEHFDVQASGPWDAIFVGAGCHHITISFNRAHDSGVAGIQTYRSDYVTISHNIVYGNSTYTTTGIYGSGISLYENTDIDSNTGTKMVVNANYVYGNTNVPTNGGTDSDGNGIILDDSRHAQYDNVAYNGRTGIYNNLVYGNGGRGIYIYSSDHANIINNTAYENNIDPYEANWHPGEIGMNTAGDVRVYNNIAYSTGSYQTATGNLVGISVESGSGEPITIDYNGVYNLYNSGYSMYLGGTGHLNSNVVTAGTHNLVADPLFSNAVSADFTLQPESPDGTAGLASIALPKDIHGQARSPLGPVSTGAFEITF